MFLARKIGWTGLALTLLIAGFFVQESPRSVAGSDSGRERSEAFFVKDETKKMQETLHNKGHDPGIVDGVFGLRTRTSIREYQKAENLPATGQVDRRTADGLGVRPEATWANSENDGRTVGYGGGELKTDKPSAGIPWSEGGPHKASRKRVSRATAVKDNPKVDQ
ncbi:MAG: peptidoglycan-binding domain-containing protein [Terriglobales bacterium]